MPAAAVTPAAIAYIKVVAVKKLVVGTDGWSRGETIDLNFGSLLKPLGLHGFKAGLLFTTDQICRCGVSRFTRLRGLGSRVAPRLTVRGAFHRVSRATGELYFEQNRVLKAGDLPPECYSMAYWNRISV